MLSGVMQLVGSKNIVRPARELCPDCPYGGPRVGSRGNPDSDFVIVGESPGAHELRVGIPVVGPTGTILFGTLPEGEETDVYITNALLCYPRKKDPTKLAAAARTCQQRLLTDIGRCPRKIILALGNAAVWSLTGDFTSKITKIRGKPVDSPLALSGIVPAVHPAALLRGTGSYRQFKEDVLYSYSLLNGESPRIPVPHTHVVCKTVKQVRAALKDLRKGKYIAADIETEGLDRQRHKILSIGFSRNPKLVYIIPANRLKYCKAFLQSKKHRFIWHSGKFDIAFLRRSDTAIAARVDEDTMLLSYALDETGGIHDLEQIGGDLFDAPDYKYKIKPYLENKDSLYSDIPPDVLYDYQASDVSLTLQIFKTYRPRVRADKKLELLYTKTLIPSSELYYHVENNGILVDPVRLQANIDRLGKIADKNLAVVQEIAGYEINPSSPQQLAEYLFDHLKLRPKGNTKRSTAKEVLAKLPQVPFIIAIGEFRKALKAKSTYGTSIAREIKDDDRVHTTINIHGTRTGRPSSKEPNVFNVPRDEQIRGTYVAANGNIFVEYDLNQAELRSLACLSRDKWLCNVYNSTGRSLHKEVAKEFFGGNFNHEEYMRAKMVNFGIVYGRTGGSLDYEYDWPTGTGAAYIDRWFERMPEAHKFILRCRNAPKKLQTISTVFGNKKRHWVVSKMNLWSLQNEAANFPHQNIASNINLHGAIKIKPMLDSFGAKMVNLVYDSILIECVDDAATVRQIIELGIPIIESIAPEWGMIEVPFKVDAKVGHRWGSLNENHKWLKAA